MKYISKYLPGLMFLFIVLILVTFSSGCAGLTQSQVKEKESSFPYYYDKSFYYY